MENIITEQIRNSPEYGVFLTNYAHVVGLPLHGQLGSEQEISKSHAKALASLETLIMCFKREAVREALEASGFVLGIITDRFPSLSRSLIPPTRTKHKKLKTTRSEHTKEPTPETIREN